MARFALIAVLLAFSALSAKALLDHGYWGIIAYHLPSTAGLQVLADLVIVCLLACLWMIADARKHGRNVVPYVLITLLFGSFGPLLYLLVGQYSQAGHGARTLA